MGGREWQMGGHSRDGGTPTPDQVRAQNQSSSSDQAIAQNYAVCQKRSHLFVRHLQKVCIRTGIDTGIL